MRAEAIMSTPVITVDPDSSIAEAAELMLSRKISCLPVARNDGTVVGIISEGDFPASFGTRHAACSAPLAAIPPRPRKVAQEYVHANGRRVDEVMTTDVVSASPGAPLAEIVELMSRHRIKNVPVVEGGKAVGIITRTDLLGALLRLLPKSGAVTADDEQIRKRVVAELQGQTWSGGDLIGVKVNSGIVELSGAIFDERQRQAAIVAAENVAGVRAVKDGLFCAEPFSVLLVS